jgi:hypothetical protein
MRAMAVGPMVDAARRTVRAAGGALGQAVGLLRRRVLDVSLMLLLAGVAMIAVVVLIALVLGPGVASEIAVSDSIAVYGRVGVRAGLTMAVVVFAVVFVWSGVVVRIGDAALTDRRRAAAGPLRAGLRRAPRLAAVSVVTLVAFVALAAVWPFVSVIGLVGLVVDVVRRTAPSRWPSRRTWLILAVPGAAAFMVVARWSLAPVAAVLDSTSIRDALRRSTAATRGRVAQVVVSLVGAGLLTFVVAYVVTWLGGLVGGGTGATLARLLSQLIVGALPLLLVTVLYHRGVDGDRQVADTVVAPSPRSLGGASTRVALVVTMAMFLQIAAAGVGPSPALATDHDTVMVSVVFAPYPQSTVGESVTITVYASPSATKEYPPGESPNGTVEVWWDGVSQGLGIDKGNGQWQLVTSDLPPGDVLVTGKYLGDDTPTAFADWEPGEGSNTQRVRYATTLALASDGSPSTLGDAVTFTATTSSAGPEPTGAVEFTVGGGPLVTVALSGGAASHTVTALPEGDTTITAEYVPDGVLHAGSSAPDLVQSVGRISTTTVLTLGGVSPSLAADLVAATVTVRNSDGGTPPTGAVELFDDGVSLGASVPLVSGVATVDLDLDVGDHSISARYIATDPFSASSALAVARVIEQRDSETTVSVSPTATTYGDVATVTATVAFPGTTRVATGQVKFWDGTSLMATRSLGAGTASVETTSLGVGAHTINVQYLGDAVGRASEGSVTIEVSAAPLADITPTVNLYGPLDPTDFTEDAVFNVWVRPAPPAGVTVSISDRNLSTLATGVLDADGRATLTVVDHDAGTQHYSVLFPGLVEGAQTYKPSRSAERQHEILQATAAMTASIGPAPLVATETATIVAPLTSPVAPHPTGLVEIRSLPAFTLIAMAPIVEGAVSVDWVLQAGTQSLRLIYRGDANFTAVTIDIPAVVERRAPDVAFSFSPAAPVYGDIITLRATSLVGGGAPGVGTVTFFADIGNHLGTAELVNGVAELAVCAGPAPTCPAGLGSLNVSEHDVRFQIGATAELLEADSDVIAITVLPAPTTVDMMIRPAPAQIWPGSAVFLDVAISSDDPALIPTGSVSWWAVRPGEGAFFIDRSVLLSGGTARLELRAGDRFLTAATTAIRVDYHVFGQPFVGSSAVFPVNIVKPGASLQLDPLWTTVETDVTPQLNIRTAPGTDRAPTGTVTFTSDTGRTCEVRVTSRNVVGCPFSWPHVGAGTMTATYSGDDFYQSAPAVDAQVLIRPRAPDFFYGGTAPSFFYGGAGSTFERGEVGSITWQLPAAVTSGEVRVFVDQQPFCVAQALDGTCEGTFAPVDRSDEVVELSLQYRGNDDWLFIERTVRVQVRACYPLRVPSRQPALGTGVAVTPPNCSQAGVQGYRPGTMVTATATAIAPYEFAEWLRPALRGTDPVRRVSTDATYSFRLTHSWDTWESIASFRLPCLTPTLSTSEGFGNLVVNTPSNCQTPARVDGWEWGTELRVSGSPDWNVDRGEYDRFVGFDDTLFASTVLPTVGGDTLSFVLNVPGMPVSGVFGPFCRELPTTNIARAHVGDSVSIVAPAIDCVSPSGDGYRRTTSVEVVAVPGDPSSVVSGWAVDGVRQELLGRELAISVTPTDVPVTIAPQFVSCWTVEVRYAYMQNLEGETIGRAFMDTAFDCPDGSDRFLDGSAVSMTASLLGTGAQFRGFSLSDATNLPQSAPLQQTVTVAGDAGYQANFYDRSVCSRLTVFDPDGLISDLSLLQSGCGPGYYYDKFLHDRAAGIRSPEEANCCRLFLDLDPTAVGSSRAGVYVVGQAKDCWPLTCNGPVGGPLTLEVSRCQDLVGHARILRPGEELSDPGTWGALAPGAWIRDLNTVRIGEFGEEACGEYSYRPETTFTVIPTPPASGYEFLQWENVDGLQSLGLFTAEDGTDVPMVGLTADTTSARLNVGTVWRVDCFTLTLGSDVKIVEPAPNCPFPEFGGNAYAENTLVFVEAQTAGRDFEEWHTGYSIASLLADEDAAADAVEIGAEMTAIGLLRTPEWLPSQVTNLGSDQVTGEPVAVVVMDYDKSVTVEYITAGDRVANVAALAGRIFIGIAAMVAVGAMGAALTMVCAPCGIGVIAFSMGIVASIALSAIPGVGDGPAKIAGMMDPFSCVGSWAFNREADQATPGDKKIVTTTVKVSVDTAKALAASADAGTRLARYAGSYATKAGYVGAAGLGYAVLSNVSAMDMTYQSTDDQFNDRGIDQCYKDQYSL